MNPRSVTTCHQQPSNLPQPDSLSVFFLLEVCAGDEDNDCVQYDYLQGDVQDDVRVIVQDNVLQAGVQDDVQDDLQDVYKMVYKMIYKTMYKTMYKMMYKNKT